MKPPPFDAARRDGSNELRYILLRPLDAEIISGTCLYSKGDQIRRYGGMIASYRLSEINCSKDVACCKSWINLLVSVSNTEYLEQSPKIGKACVLNLMSFGEMTNEGEVSPCRASSSACWLRTSSEWPLTLTRITVMLRLCIHVRIRFHIGNMGLLYLWAGSIL